jgi:hypothetical protein
MRCDTIVGYTFNADVCCPDCIARMFGGLNALQGAEQILDHAARWRNIDRADESSFDSGDFPKVVFADALDAYCCGQCGDAL